MDLNYSIEEADGYLMAVLKGEWSPDTMQQAIRDIASAAKERRCTRVLADVRELAAPTTEFDRFLSGKDIAAHFGPLIKVAGVCPAELINKFAENVAVNRGATMAVFSDINEAVGWLLDSPTKPWTATE